MRRKISPATARGRSGFTLIETVVTLAILLVMFGLSAPFLFSFHTRGLLSDAVEQISQDLRRAQTLAIAGEGVSGVGGRNHGVFFDVTGERWVLFTGSAYAEGAPTNEAHVLPSAVDLFSVTTSSIVFAERVGRTSNTGAIVVRSGGEQVTLTVNAAGQVSR